LDAVAGSPRYRVFHSASEQWTYDESQLSAVDLQIGGNFRAAIESEQWLDPRVFRARLTAARLAHPQVDALYALQAARIKFISFQMKPLLRFLRAERPRLLIADEVGVGKTIEAGLILKEMQTRQQVDNVLIVCPKALVPKWKAEMRRFDEDFYALTSADLAYCLSEAYKDGGLWPVRYARSITHLELLRSGDYLEGTDDRRPRPGLKTLDPAPSFDLVIIDEAHHVRNPGTNSYELAKTLCEMAEAVVFLSATPVHVGSTNLYSLLNLLRPDLFPDEAVFADILEPNKYVTEAMRHVRSAEPAATWQHDAALGLDRALTTRWGRRVLAAAPRFTAWHTALQRGDIADDAARIRCLRDLEELHTLAQVMNRTRRRDIGRFTIRDPHTVSVAFTPEQEVLYHALIDFRRRLLELEHDPWVARLIADTLERQAASCLPALLPTIDRFLQVGAMRMADVSDELEAEEEAAEVALPAQLVQQAEVLRMLAQALSPDDPKLEQLKVILTAAIGGSGPNKVLVFSFFLHTLGYLRTQLLDAGYRVAMISGQIVDEEREHLRDRFRLPYDHAEALDVLLSSEVGCEGLDYEFCDRLVNYDIPWNPMRIEQRIGRIDRFGQNAEKVLIYNFITPGTVEERIHFRCFERLGVFRDTVGDLEEVLGEVVEELKSTAMDPTLTAGQAEQKARQTADNALRLIEEQDRLERDSKGLLGLDQGFTEEMETARRQGKFISSNDLRVMIEEYLTQPAIDGRISPDGRQASVERLILRREGRVELQSHLSTVARHDRQATEFRRWLGGNQPHLLVTFDQDTALEHRDIPFITPVHPLAKLAIEFWQSKIDPLVSALAVQDDMAPAGRYLFVCDLWRTVAVNPEVRLICLAYDLKREEVSERVSTELLRLIEHAAPPEEVLSATGIEPALHRLEEEAHDQRRRELGELRERNALLVTRRLVSLDTYYKNRLQRVTEERVSATNQRIMRMKDAERARIFGDYQMKRGQINGRREADIISERIAAGILEVRGAG